MKFNNYNSNAKFRRYRHCQCCMYSKIFRKKKQLSSEEKYRKKVEFDCNL